MIYQKMFVVMSKHTLVCRINAYVMYDVLALCKLGGMCLLLKSISISLCTNCNIILMSVVHSFPPSSMFKVNVHSKCFDVV